MRMKQILAVCGLIFLAAPAMAEDKPKPNINYAQVVEMMSSLVGGGVETDSKDGQRVISVTVDRAKVNRDVQKLQAIGLLNPDITTTFINTHDNPAPMAMATQFVVMTIIAKYRSTDIDKCTFAASFLITDEYGQERKQPLFTFRFDRKLFNKINYAQWS